MYNLRKRWSHIPLALCSFLFCSQVTVAGSAVWKVGPCERIDAGKFHGPVCVVYTSFSFKGPSGSIGSLYVDVVNGHHVSVHFEDSQQFVRREESTQEHHPEADPARVDFWFDKGKKVTADCPARRSSDYANHYSLATGTEVYCVPTDPDGSLLSLLTHANWVDIAVMIQDGTWSGRVHLEGMSDALAIAERKVRAM